jgi:hypothetical protein
MRTKMTDEERKAWLAIRKEAGLKIDPETAEVDWIYAHTLDPYGVYPDLPEDCQQVGREYFARSPGGDVWVWFGDLPDATRDALWERHKSKLAFPAGLPLALLKCGHVSGGDHGRLREDRGRQRRASSGDPSGHATDSPHADRASLDAD